MSKFKNGDYVMIRKDIPLYCEIVDGRPCESYYSLKKWIDHAGTVGVVTDAFDRNNSSYYAIRDPLKNMNIGYFHEKQLNRITNDQLQTLINRTAYEFIKHDNSVRGALHRLISEKSDYKRIIGIAKATKSALHAVDQGKSANKHFKEIAKLASGQTITLIEKLINWLHRDCNKTWTLVWIAMAGFTGAILLNSCMCFGVALVSMIAMVITA